MHACGIDVMDYFLLIKLHRLNDLIARVKQPIDVLLRLVIPHNPFNIPRCIFLLLWSLSTARDQDCGEDDQYFHGFSLVG